MLDLAVFDSRYAENEPWLDQVFVPPIDFELMVAPRSAVIFGDIGSGKTAMRQALVRQVISADGYPTRLLVEWHPMTLWTSTFADSCSVQVQLRQVLDACALAVLQHLVRYPLSFSNALPWVQDILVLFVRQYLQGNFGMRIATLLDQADATDQSLLRDLSTRSASSSPYPSVLQEMIIARLVDALRELHLDGVWIIVDGPESLINVDPVRLDEGLTVVFSVLDHFEQSGFTYKILLPTDLRPSVEDQAIERQRIEVYQLQWTESQLVDLLEKRLDLASGGILTKLSDLCEAEDDWIKWLLRCGGVSPRGWLEYTCPLVAAYLERARQGKVYPFSEMEWHGIYRRYPLSLRLDESAGQIMVGWRKLRVDDVPPTVYKLLRYFCRNPRRICSKSELYYRAVRQMDTEPQTPSDEGWEPPAKYSGLIDTSIWRLREAIEPNFPSPQLVITIKDQGYQLDNVPVIGEIEPEIDSNHFNIAELRRLLESSFDDPTLNAFCQAYYPVVYDDFSRGMRKSEKITLLLDYCRRHPDECRQLESIIRNYLVAREIDDTEREEMFRLQQFLIDRFSLDELKDLADALIGSHELLPHQTRPELAKGLMNRYVHRNKLSCLVQEAYRRQSDDFLAQLLAKLPPCQPDKDVVIYLSGPVLQRRGVSEAEFQAKVATMLEISVEQIGIKAAAWNSLRLLASLPEHVADSLLSLEMSSLGKSECRIESIEDFDSLDTANQEAWRLLVRVGASFREEGILRPTVLWQEVLKLSGRRLSPEEIHILLREERMVPLWLVNCDLSGVDFSGADLRKAYLYGANLSRADLRGADLRGADLRKADLSEADLRGADLHGTDLRGANLNMTNLEKDYLDRKLNKETMSAQESTNWEANNSAIMVRLTKTILEKKASETKGPVGRFTKRATGEWEPLAYPGYTIITPPFEEDQVLVNIATYARLGDVQQILLGRLGLAQYAPVPISSFHFTLVDLVSGKNYEEHIARESHLRQAISSCFDQLDVSGTVQMEVLGLSLFTTGVLVALVGVRDEPSYQRLRLFRQVIYDDATLRKFGVWREYSFMGHVTLAYIEDELQSPDQTYLAKTLIDMNAQFFVHSLPLNINRADLRKFDDLSRFYRQEGWPIYHFE